MELSYIFLKENFSYISGNGNPLKNSMYFRKRKFLMFQEIEALETSYIYGRKFFYAFPYQTLFYDYNKTLLIL